MDVGARDARGVAGVHLLLGGHVPCCHARFRRSSAVVAVFAPLLAASCTTVGALPPGARSYRAPVVALAYPERGASLPADKPVVLLRFAVREADDPIDPASFKATIDGVDRTSHFRVSGTEAWGTLGDTTASPAAVFPGPVLPGPHTLAARICSVRGVCGSTTAVIDVRAWETALGAQRPKPAHRSLFD